LMGFSQPTRRTLAKHRPPAKPMKAASIFEGTCAACHGLEGRGGEPGDGGKDGQKRRKTEPG